MISNDEIMEVDVSPETVKLNVTLTNELKETLKKRRLITVHFQVGKHILDPTQTIVEVKAKHPLTPIKVVVTCDPRDTLLKISSTEMKLMDALTSDIVLKVNVQLGRELETFEATHYYTHWGTNENFIVFDLPFDWVYSDPSALEQLERVFTSLVESIVYLKWSNKGYKILLPQGYREVRVSVVLDRADEEDGVSEKSIWVPVPPHININELVKLKPHQFLISLLILTNDPYFTNFLVRVKELTEMGKVSFEEIQ